MKKAASVWTPLFYKTVLVRQEEVVDLAAQDQQHQNRRDHFHADVEHTAALDPAMAKKVLHLTKEIVLEHNLCTIMVTHNMKSALEYGNRTIMMHEGRIIMDLAGEEREAMTVEQLVKQFERQSGEELDNDRLLLA